jgi:hypothetical protein
MRDSDVMLLEAAEAGDLAACKASIAAGANVNCVSPDGWTPLLSAAKDSPQVVELLLANQANPNLASDRGYTPLMRAAGNGDEEIVIMLLAAGADTLARDCNGKTAAQLARETSQFLCADLVKDAQPKAAAHPNRMPLEGSYGAVMVFAPPSSQPYHLVCVEFADGTVLKDAKVFDSCDLEVPDSCIGKKIAKLSVNLRQP